MAVRFPSYLQLDEMDCGPTCLRMVASYHGKVLPMEYLKEIAAFSRTGVSLKSIMEAAKTIGLESMAVKISDEELLQKAPKPCIIHWEQNHFVVIPPQNFKSEKIKVSDPRHGMVKVPRHIFFSKWHPDSADGVALLLQPNEKFHALKEPPASSGLRFIAKYLRLHLRKIVYVILTLIVTSGLTLLFPLLTQALVDKGIEPKDKNIVVLILIAQLALFFGNSTMELIRSWIVLHANTRINISMVSDFLIKLARLPLRFFDARRVGDIQQRILDHDRIEQFLSGQTLSTLFSFANFLVFSVVLASYNLLIFGIFLIFSACAVAWIWLFLKKRKELDMQLFALNSRNQNALNELVSGMPEIKLNRAEEMQKQGWQGIQEDLYLRNTRSLRLQQWQMMGAAFFNQTKNILISFVSAIAVIDGNMTMGMLLAVAFIVGQMNSPLDQLLGFVQLTQDARLSIQRLEEVHLKEEETPDNGYHRALPLGDIQLSNVCFRYEWDWVLQDVSCCIPRGQVTAIVGASGSGKTTLLKLLLQFYNPQEGNITIGNTALTDISLSSWRDAIGVVMQDGFIFSDSIQNNITMSYDGLDQKRFDEALSIANLSEMVARMPLREQTLIGANGVGLSHGQQQRILIARAIYKNPEIIFLDEATSSLDAKNEKQIIDALDTFTADKTVLVIAHRLSTVKNADQILVLDNGKLVEAGSHEQLTQKRGKYFELIQNQLEMGA